MNKRERLLSGEHGVDISWWIFSLSFSVSSLRNIRKPIWFANLLCKFGKHDWWINGNDFRNPIYKCLKCGVKIKNGNIF
jgi:hypothetical protein